MTAINYVRDLAGGEWRRLPRVPQSGPVGQAARWCETSITFARLCLCGIETAVAFAGEKWAFLVQFVNAKVMAVSAVPCWGRAVVIVVSCLPASVAAEVSLVSTSPRRCVPCAKKFALRRCRHREDGGCRKLCV